MPRERSGSVSAARFGFQAHVSALKLLDLHAAGSTFHALFDYFDDLTLFVDDAGKPRVRFYQVKGKSSGRWTVDSLCKLEDGEVPKSIIGKMFYNADLYPTALDYCAFLTDASFNFKLPSGVATTPDHISIGLSELQPAEQLKVSTCLGSDCPTISLNPANVLRFERSEAGSKNFALVVKGKLASIIDDLHDGAPAPTIAIYKTLITTIDAKTHETSIFGDFADVLKGKGLSSSEIAAMFQRAAASPRFMAAWSDVSDDLKTKGIMGVKLIKLKSACVEYLRNRAAGETAEVAFSLGVQGLDLAEVASNADHIWQVADAIKSAILPDLMAAVIDADAGALVEAYELINE